MQPIRSLSLRDILNVLFKNKSMIFTIIAASVVASVGYCLFSTQIYQAETKLLVKMGREKLSEIDFSAKEVQNILIQERTQNINNEIEILKGQYITEKVFPKLRAKLEEAKQQAQKSWLQQVRAFAKDALKTVKQAAYAPLYYVGWSRKLSEEEMLKQAFHRALRVEFIEDTDIIKVSFRSSDPAFAAFAVNAYTEEYLVKHIGVNENEKSQGFYEDQISLYEEKLSKAENELQSFLESGEVYNIPLQKELLLKNIEELKRKHGETLIEYEDISLKINKVRNMTRDSEDWIETPSISGYRNELADLKTLDETYFKLKAERGQAVEFFKAGSREVYNIDNQLAKLRKQKSASVLTILAMEHEAVKNKKDNLERTLSHERKNLDRLNSLVLTAERLDRTRSVLQGNYLMYLKKSEELRILDDMNKRQITSVKVINPALAPLYPIYPKKWLVLALSLLFGILASLLYALVREFFDHTFRDQHDVASVLGLSLLMTVPLVTPAETGSALPVLEKEGAFREQPEAQ